MGLVHGDEAHAQTPQKRLESREGKSLRGQVQNLELSGQRFGLDPPELGRRQSAVDELRSDAVGLQRVDLVFH